MVQAGTYASGSIVLDRSIGADVTITGIPQPGTDDQTATEVSTSTTDFGNNLGTGDTTVQAALDTLDDLTISGGGGTPLAVTTADIASITFTEGLTAEIDPAAINTAVDTGIAVPANTKTILVNYGASTDAATAGRDLLWFPMPIEEWERLDGVDCGDTPTQGNARFTRIWRDADITAVGAVMARQVWLGKGNNGNIFVWSDNTAWDIYPFRARFEIHEPLTVVTDVTGGGGGGGGTAGRCCHRRYGSGYDAHPDPLGWRRRDDHGTCQRSTLRACQTNRQLSWRITMSWRSRTFPSQTSSGI